MAARRSLTDRLYPHWVPATAILLVVLICYAPFALMRAPHAIMLVAAFGPLYMLHQLEEHAGDRFRTFANAQVFGGRDALSREIVLVANIPGVWGVNLLALYAAALFGAGWGLASAYGVVINGAVHGLVALRLRRYNPGLWTGLALFLPIGAYALVALPGDILQHIMGASVGLGAHLLLVAVAWRRYQTLPAA